MFITRANSDLMITRIEIEFGKVFCFAKAVVEVVDAWYREIVFNSDIVQAMVIDTHSHRSIFLFHKKNRCTKRAARKANVSNVKVFIDLAFSLTEFIFGLTIKFARGNFVVGSQIDGVTQAIRWRKFLRKFRWKESGELSQSFVFNMVGELCSVFVIRVDVSIKLFKRAENTDKKLCVERSRVAHKFNSRNNLRRRSSRCAKEVH